ncbi:MAG TPA: hypothetical protein VGM80_14620 [Gaiellaceae bacterium]
MSGRGVTSDRRDTPFAIQRRLEDEGLRTWIFGGWAEELRGLRNPGPHSDIDLLYPAGSFDLLDAVLVSAPELEQITEKRFSHKRAFVAAGTMVEVFLLRPCGNRHVTHFWGQLALEWPEHALGELDGARVASVSALGFYRAEHARIDGVRKSLAASPSG